MAKRTIYLDNYGQDGATTSSSRSRSASNPDPNGGLFTFFQGVIQEARTLVSSRSSAGAVKAPTIEKKM
ncbi:hypothetical protein PT974_07368 [Cladobotryum mycophilum]|uniref:Uncharacterized protein n=1 Tax=Cladobotryum mycophilum TaxID=491253 RepID=A0ABR0SQB1_9HYPO